MPVLSFMLGIILMSACHWVHVSVRHAAQVSWSGVKNPGVNDAVALLVPSTASLSTVVPVSSA